MSVCYSKGGHWRPSIPGQVCTQCGVVYTAHKHGQRFCSKACSGLSRRGAKVAYTERTCPGCGLVWHDYPSNPSQFCSKKCIFDSGKWAKPVERECLTCGSLFTVSPRKVGHYCSAPCAKKGLEKDRIGKVCAHCGESFYVTQHRKNEATCSRKCRDAYYLRDRAPTWKGGEVLQNERRYRRTDREGYQAKYEGEHRLVAAREIGRTIARGEVIICIDRNNENISPKNLFMLPNFSELGLLMAGVVEWPAASNLQEYRVSGYRRPEVRVVLHEWENGRRRDSDKGKPITRHPQADEIIKRRRAGATARQLSAAFDTALSTMAHILRSRL